MLYNDKYKSCQQRPVCLYRSCFRGTCTHDPSRQFCTICLQVLQMYSHFLLLDIAWIARLILAHGCAHEGCTCSDTYS